MLTRTTSGARPYNGVNPLPMPSMFRTGPAAAGFGIVAVSVTMFAGCSRPSAPPATKAAVARAVNAAETSAGDAPLPGMPPVLDAHNIYAADGPGDLSPAV